MNTRPVWKIEHHMLNVATGEVQIKTQEFASEKEARKVFAELKPLNVKIILKENDTIFDAHGTLGGL